MECNIGLVGVYGVGKTSIFNEIQRKRRNEAIPIRSGKTVKFLDKWTHRTLSSATQAPMQITLWDTGGMERNGTQSMTKSYFIQTEAFILVYDMGNLDTLQRLRAWVELAEDLSTANHKLFSLWGNRTDTQPNPVTESDIKNYADAFRVPSDLVCEVDASSGWNVNESYQTFIDAVQSLSSQVPLSPFSDAAEDPRKTRVCQFC